MRNITLSFSALKTAGLAFFAALTLAACQSPAEGTSASKAVNNPEEWVNPLMGTDSDFSLSNGNTYPAIATPWAMNFWTPQTGTMGNGWGYTYDAQRIRGIKQTHQPSPWINDYAAFSLMAVTGELKYNEEDRASYFSHKAEEVHPYHYSVYLADHDVTAEVTPTERAAQFRFTFPEGDDSYLIVDAFHKGSMVNIDPETRTVTGYCRNNSGGVPDNFHNYFVIQFDQDFEAVYSWDKEGIKEGRTKHEGEHVGAAIRFKTAHKEQIIARVASSFISPEQALLNLNREIGKDTFEQTMAKAKQAWNTELSRIAVEGSNEEHIKTFYSSLYRVLLFPRKFFEFDADNNVVHYSPYNGEVLPGYMFTDNGFWDTFRAVFPFFNMMYPELNSQIMAGLVNTYKESGWLPEWASPGHRNCMIGSNSATLIADAYLSGVRGYDIETLYEAMVKNTLSVGPLQSVGRAGAEYYNDLGYVPYNVGIKENAARTLEYAFADYCIYALGKELGKPEAELELYKSRSQNYRNLFDPETGWMRGKNEDGNFQTPFNPLKWGDAFTEGNSLHYTWSVFHDMDGLVDLMGGQEGFAAKLDTVFTMAPKFDNSYYGFTIHEIREMQIANMGNYAHGNQPIQHMIYLYNYAGQPWKAQNKVREVINRMYSSMPDGYCGDEDNGQTSAWYVYSSLGFYPVTPASGQYVIGSPLFDKVTMKLQNGNEFVIEANNNGEAEKYIQSANLNGADWNKTYINCEDLQKGGTLKFEMGDAPQTSWGTAAESRPFSM